MRFATVIAAFTLAVSPALADAPTVANHGAADRALSPGSIITGKRADVCTVGWSRAHRNVTVRTRAAVWRAYNLTPQKGWELDHVIPLELGGGNVAANLFPQAPPFWRAKDIEENRLHREVCAYRMQLRSAVAAMRRGWVR